MDTTELKRLLQSLADNLRENNGDGNLVYRIGLIVITALLAYLGLE